MVDIEGTSFPDDFRYLLLVEEKWRLLSVNKLVETPCGFNVVRYKSTRLFFLYILQNVIDSVFEITKYLFTIFGYVKRCGGQHDIVLILCELYIPSFGVILRLYCFIPFFGGDICSKQ